MSIKDEVDTNINNYDNSELREIIGLNKNTTNDEIDERLDKIIEKYSVENNTKYTNFFINVKNKLLSNENTNDNKDNSEDQSETWYKNQYLLPQNQNQKDKITHRSDSVKISNDTTIPTMKREMLGINNTIPLKIAQDSLNPILRQTIKRIITIDTTFLPNSIPYSFKTTGNNSNENANFSITLSETLKNVLSIKLLSINIPSTDYTFDTNKSNTFFYIQYSATYTKDFTDCSCVKVSIRPGNYNTTKKIIDEINFDISYCSNKYNNQLNDLSGLRLTIQNENVENQIVQFLNFSDYYIKIIFYDPKFDDTDCSGCSGDIRSSCRKNATYKECLGYILGYRINTENKYSLDIILPPFSSLDNSSIFVSLQTKYFNYLSSGSDNLLNSVMNSTIQLLWTQPDYYNIVIGGTLVKGVGSVSINLSGGSYILFTLDDHTNNYPTNGMIGINPPETKLSIPKYRDKIVDPSANNCDPSNNNNLQIIPTFPRTLTQSQLYALNSIINNRKETNADILPPNPIDLFALLPRSSIKSLNSKAIVYNNPNTLFMRTYFGPITLEKLSIKLIDSYGNLINLNGHPWTFTLEAEQLYQY